VPHPSGLRVGSWRSGSAMSHAGSGTEEELVGTVNPLWLTVGLWLNKV
jgi:hypothetical protein